MTMTMVVVPMRTRERIATSKSSPLSLSSRLHLLPPSTSVGFTPRSLRLASPRFYRLVYLKHRIHSFCPLLVAIYRASPLRAGKASEPGTQLGQRKGNDDNGTTVTITTRSFYLMTNTLHFLCLWFTVRRDTERCASGRKYGGRIESERELLRASKEGASCEERKTPRPFRDSSQYCAAYQSSFSSHSLWRSFSAQKQVL
jgi:hypothetical protein